MSVIIALKTKDKTILATDNCRVGNIVKYPLTFNKEYKIQKFKNVVIAYNGEYKYFVKLVDTFDFNKFPSPLTLSYLLRNFYPDFINFIVNNDLAKMYKNSIECIFLNLMIFDGNNVFDVCNDGVFEVNYFNVTGENDISFLTYDYFKKNLKPLELVKKMFDESTKIYSHVSYPLIYCEDLENVTIVNKDGTYKKEKLIEHWRDN